MAKPGRKKKQPPLTPQEKQYVQARVLTGSIKKAEEVAGYKEGEAPENLKRIRNYAKEYREEMEGRFQSKADEMIEELYNLAKNSESEKIRLGAVKDWLDRAGLAPVSKSEVEQKRVISADSMVSRELINRLTNLQKGNKKGEE